MLVSSRLTLSLVIQHHNFGWSPHHLSFPQSFGTYIFVDLQTTYSSRSHLLHNTAATLGYIYNPLTPEESLSIMEKAFSNWFCPNFPCHRKSQVRTQIKSRKPFFKVSSLSPQRALEVAACRWHAFSNDRNEMQIEPVRVRLDSNKKWDKTLCPVPFFYDVRQRIRTFTLTPKPAQKGGFRYRFFPCHR